MSYSILYWKRLNALTRKQMKKVRNFTLYITLLILSYLFSVTPRRFSFILSRIIGTFFYYLLKKDREIALRNLALIFGKKEENKALAKKAFQNAAFNLIDYIGSCREGRLKTILDHTRVKGLENIASLYNTNKGIIVVTAHLSTFEFIPLVVASKDYRVGVVGRKLFSEKLNRYLIKLRQRLGVVNVNSDDTRGLLKLLNSGYMVGILMDQRSRGVHSIRGEFMGHPADIVTGPIKLAMKWKYPVVSISIRRNKDLNYTVEFGPPIEINPEQTLKENIQRVIDRLEKLILANKEEWIWFHRRWDIG